MRLEDLTMIRAPIERCFDLARGVEVHLSLLRERNAVLKGLAESPEWQRYLPSSL